MDYKERILKRADQLIDEGRAVLATEYHAEGRHYVENEQFCKWRPKVQTLIGKIEQDEGHYHQALTKSPGLGTNADSTRNCVAVLEAFRDDVENDMFVRVEDLVSAEVFDDLLEQAECLLNASYAAPAASLAGAVLERELRVLAKSRGVWKKGDALAKLNEKLASGRLYSAVKKTKIATWTKIRNHADHGEFGEVRADEVRQMIEGIRGFLDSMIEA